MAAASTIVEIIKSLQTSLKQRVKQWYLRQQKLSSPYRRRQLERRGYLIYDSRNYQVLIDFPLIKRQYRESTIVEIIKSLQTHAKANMVTILSTIVEIIKSLQTHKIQSLWEQYLRQQKLSSPYRPSFMEAGCNHNLRQQKLSSPYRLEKMNNGDITVNLRQQKLSSPYRRMVQAMTLVYQSTIVEIIKSLQTVNSRVESTFYLRQQKLSSPYRQQKRQKAP